MFIENSITCNTKLKRKLIIYLTEILQSKAKENKRISDNFSLYKTKKKLISFLLA